MQRKLRLFILILLGFSALSGANAQTPGRYWVVLSNKKGSVLNRDEFYAGVLERQGLSAPRLPDSSDFPLSPPYIQRIKRIVKNTGHESRWLNAVAVKATRKQLEALSALPFVESVVPISGEFYVARFEEENVERSDYEDLRSRQLARFSPGAFYSHGINGRGVRVAIFDAGFPGVDTHRAFDHIRRSNRIVATYDFTRNSPHVYRGNQHGTMVLACIAGKYNGKPMGLATEAEFMLAITEVNREPFSEEENWVAALEWAHRNGAQIINSSLGYTYHRYFPEQMDGKSTLISRAASLAAEKGIVVVNAAGNEGDGRWSVIGAPADADNILSVGGISPSDHLHIGFASYGPTVDGRLKPNVSAFGMALVANKKGGYSLASGTSFASPLVTGFVACALQANPSAAAYELLSQIERSADLYPYFDYAHGYGVPQANQLYLQPDTTSRPARIALRSDGQRVFVQVNGFDPKEHANYNTTHLFWHIRKPDGTLAEYGVVRVYQPDAFIYRYGSLIDTNQNEGNSGYSFWVNYLGRTYSVNL